MFLVVAWDGACFDVLDPLLAAGRIPTLAALLSRAAVRDVVSTTPAVTFPAWTTFVTAASPARHGVTDFTVRDGYGVRFLNASHRRLPALWSILSDHGGSAGVYALPVTYPPDPFDGFMVCGFDTPLGPSRFGARTHPAALAGEIERRYGDLAVGGPSQSRIEAGWHERALQQMTRMIELRTQIVADMIRERDLDCFIVHYGESDTVAHQFWHLCDSRSPRFADGAPADAIATVYERLDAALAVLLDAAGPDATVMIVSDHGTGGTSDRAVFWNRWLAEHGYLRFRDSPAGASAARFARTAALRVVPGRWQSSLLAAMPAAAARLESGARLGGIDWPETQAFSEELGYFPSIWLNLRGRDPQGHVEPEEGRRVLARLARELREFRDPFDGAAVVERVLLRDEIADGPYADRFPDLILELRRPEGYSYACMSSRAGREPDSMRILRPEEKTGARGTSMAGAHRPRGMCVLTGARIRPGAYGAGTLADAGATAMALCGCAPHFAANGRAWSDCVDLPRGVGPSRLDVESTVVDYTIEEEAALADRLRALGYLS